MKNENVVRTNVNTQKISLWTKIKYLLAYAHSVLNEQSLRCQLDDAIAGYDKGGERQVSCILCNSKTYNDIFVKVLFSHFYQLFLENNTDATESKKVADYHGIKIVVDETLLDGIYFAVKK